MTDEAKRLLGALRALGVTSEDQAIETALNLLLVVEKMRPGFGLTVGRTGQNQLYFAEVRDTDTELFKDTPRSLHVGQNLSVVAQMALRNAPLSVPAYTGRSISFPAGDVLGELPDVG